MDVIQLCVCVFKSYFLLLPRYVLEFSPYHRRVYIVMSVTSSSILAKTLIQWIVVVIVLLDVDVIYIANKCMNIIIFRPSTRKFFRSCHIYYFIFESMCVLLSWCCWCCLLLLLMFVTS